MTTMACRAAGRGLSFTARWSHWQLAASQAMSSALAYFDGYRSGRLPANLLQAQRDYFGAHTYERTDKPRGEHFHLDWPDPTPTIGAGAGLVG